MKKFFLYTILILMALSMILPFFMMFLISLSGNENIFTDYKNINLSFCAYKNVFKAIPVARYFLNSLIVALCTTIGQVLISALAGYGFARLDFKGKDGTVTSKHCSPILPYEQTRLDKYLLCTNRPRTFWRFWRILYEAVFYEFLT